MLLLRSTVAFVAATLAAAQNNFFDLTAVDIDGNQQSFEQFRGKVVLAVNVATD